MNNAKILVVDDMAVNLEVTAFMLSPYGVRVDTSLSGAEALRFANDTAYDLIFMDQMMPEMDGVETTRRIKESGGPSAKTPIIALTANTGVNAESEFIRMGFDGFLAKPVDAAPLDAVIKKWISFKKRAAFIIAGADDVRKNKDCDIVIDGVDTARALLRCGGTVSNYMRMLSMFCKDGSEKISDIQKSRADKNWQAFAIAAHAIKGAAANIGAMTFSETAAKLESAAEVGDTNFIIEQTPRFVSDMEDLFRRIEHVVLVEKKNLAATTFDIEKLKSHLNDLVIAIEKFDPTSINTAMRKLRVYETVDVDGVGEKVERILEHTLLGEHKEAVELIKSF